MTTEAAIARSKIDHPLIDGDSHIVEYPPSPTRLRSRRWRR